MARETPSWQAAPNGSRNEAPDASTCSAASTATETCELCSEPPKGSAHLERGWLAHGRMEAKFLTPPAGKDTSMDL